MNLTKDVKNLYTEKNYKTLLGKIKDLNKWRYMLPPWVEKFIITKVLILPKLIHRLNTIPFKIPTGFSWRNWQNDLKFYMEMQGDEISKTTLKWKSWRTNKHALVGQLKSRTTCFQAVF